MGEYKHKYHTHPLELRTEFVLARTLQGLGAFSFLIYQIDY